MNHRRLYVLPWLPILVAPLLLLSPVLFTGKALFWGTPSLQFVPWRVYAWDILSSGHLPLWNPLLGMGSPLIANYQSALFYPPNWLFFLLDALGGIGWVAWGQALLVTLHLVWAGVGMAILSRRLGLGILAQTITGLAFSLSGYLVARSGFLSINAAVSWLPWVMFAVLNLVMTTHKNSIRGVSIEPDAAESILSNGIFNRINWRYFGRLAILALVLSMQLLTGHAQTSWYTLLLAVMWGGYLGWVNAHNQYVKNRYPSRGKNQLHQLWIYIQHISYAWLRIAIAFSLAFVLAAIQLFPTGEYLLHSQRSYAVNYDFAMTYSFWPWRFLTLIAPNFFGNPVTGDYWGYGYYWEDAIYIGVLPIIIAIVEVIGLFRKEKQTDLETTDTILFTGRPLYRSSLVNFLLVLITISFVLALGKNTPIFPWLYNNVTSFSMFQAPTRFTLWAEIALIILAGLGVNDWRRPKGRGLYWIRLGTAGALAVSIGASITMYMLEDVNPTFIRAAVWAGGLGFCTGVLALTNPSQQVLSGDVRNGQKFQVWQWVVILFVATDLIIAGWGLNTGVDLQFYTEPSPTADRVRALSDGLRLYLPADDEQSLKYDRFKKADTFDIGENRHNLRATMLPNLSMLEGIRSVNNFDPLVPGRYARWMEGMEDLQDGGDDMAYHNLLNLMGVGVVEIMDYSEEKHGVRFYPVEGSERLRWVPCARLAVGEENAWFQVFGGHVDFYNEVILEGLEDEKITDCPNGFSSNSDQVSNRIIEESPNRYVIRVNSPSAGWLVLSEVWYPGWQVWVDGIAKQLLRANYLFQAVYVGPGEHEIIYLYRPMSFYLGLVASFLAWVVLFVGMWISKKYYGVTRK